MFFYLVCLGHSRIYRVWCDHIFVVMTVNCTTKLFWSFNKESLSNNICIWQVFCLSLFLSVFHKRLCLLLVWNQWLIHCTVHVISVSNHARIVFQRSPSAPILRQPFNRMNEMFREPIKLITVRMSKHISMPFLTQYTCCLI